MPFLTLKMTKDWQQLSGAGVATRIYRKAGIYPKAGHNMMRVL